MNRVSIATYTVEVKALRAKNPDCFLKFEAGPNGANAYATILKSLTALQTCLNLEDVQHLLHVTKLSGDGVNLRGLVARGEYGASAPIVSAKKLQKMYDQKKDEARMPPYYFRFHLPAGAMQGVLAIQRTGVHAPYTTLHRTLERMFRDGHEKHRLHFERAIDQATMKAVMAAPVHSYRITTYGVPPSLEDQVYLRGAKKRVGEVTVTINAPAGQTLWDISSEPAWYRQLLKGRSKLVTLWPEENVKTVRVTTTYNGKSRTFDLTEPEEIFPYRDVTEAIRFASDGNPDFDSIDEQADQIVDEVLDSLNLKVKS